MKISDIKKAYCVGIKGAGVAAIAEILKKRGIDVSGSDTKEVFYTDEILRRNNIPFYEEFAGEHVPNDVDVVVYSTAYNDEQNPELIAAREKNLPLLSYPEMLGMLFREKLGIAVCGTHGKTTTSAMLSETLLHAEFDPSAIVGSQVITWNGCALAGDGQYFVAEADEYQNKLRFYDPWLVILTSADWDHPDFFTDFAAYKDVFKQFVQKIPKTGNLVVWGDSAATLEIAEFCGAPVATYGINEENDYVIRNIQSTQEGQEFEVYKKDVLIGNFQTPLLGKHNVLNACAVIALCNIMQADMEKVKVALRNFKGTSRRFERVGTFHDALLIDDYAHHPDEIKATLAGARAHFNDKTIWTVFHPHTFTRTKALLQEFSQSFEDADRVVVIDIYGSAREQQGGVSSEDLVKLINKYFRGKADYIPDMKSAIEFFKEKSGQYDILITMGAGDVWRIAQALKQ